jgi:hypothetical protein
MASDGKIEIEVDHPSLNVTVALTGDIAAALARDLADI